MKGREGPKGRYVHMGRDEICIEISKRERERERQKIGDREQLLRRCKRLISSTQFQGSSSSWPRPQRCLRALGTSSNHMSADTHLRVEDPLLGVVGVQTYP